MLGDCLRRLETLPPAYYHTCITSPPYYRLRDYGATGQIGLEETPQEYIDKLVEVFREVRRVLRDDGTLWIVIGDTYARAAIPSLRLKPKNLIGIPWRLAFALQADGWYLRQEIIWSKNSLPESVTDRCCRSHEQIFLLSKGEKYHFDNTAIRERAVSTGFGGPRRRNPHRDAYGARGNAGIAAAKVRMKREFETLGYTTRLKRSVWNVSTDRSEFGHPATFPIDLIKPCILASAPVGGWVLDPFAGSGTTGVAARELGRHCDMIELNPTYAEIIQKRLAG